MNEILNWGIHPERKKGYSSYVLIAKTPKGDYEITSARDGYYLFFDNQDLKHLEELEEIKEVAQTHYKKVV